MLGKNNKIQLSTEQRCAMLESNYERHCFINLFATEKRTSQGDKTLNPRLRRIYIEYYSQENELLGFQGSVSDTGSGGWLCFCVICGG